MKITIRLDDKLLAGQTGRTASDVIEEASRELLTSEQNIWEILPVKLKAVSGQGLLPDVDLEDSASLLNFMDKADGPALR